MRIGELLKKQFTVSFEFYPPKTDEGETELFSHIKDLKKMAPSFVSVTYGAGGSTRDKTSRIVTRLAGEEGLNVMAHLACANHTRSEITEILRLYRDSGIDNILALRGDPPAGSDLRPEEGELPHAADLIRLIKNKFGGHFSIGIAAFPERHPESPNMDWEMRYFKEKADEGAEFAITQIFFDNEHYYRFHDRAAGAGIKIPILPGIMPITNFRQIKKMADLSRATIPSRLTEKMEMCGDNNDEVAKIGIDYAIDQCQALVSHGAPGLHFYTLNKSMATVRIYEALRGLIGGARGREGGGRA